MRVNPSTGLLEYLSDLSPYLKITEAAATYVPYTGATADVNLGAKNFLTTGTLGAGAITGTSIIKSGGTSSQFLKADGSVDTSTYLTANKAYTDDFVNGDLSTGVLTVTHNLGKRYNLVSVTDNNGKEIIPNEITMTSTSALAVDLSSYGTLTGTWYVTVIAGAT